MNKLSLYRIHHKEHRIGAIVIAREVVVGGRPGKGHRHYVTVDGVPFLDFCGASFICDIDDKQAETVLKMIKDNVLDVESIR